MIQIHEDIAVNLDSSSSLEFDRRMIVQESADPSEAADLGRCVADRHYRDTRHRELLQQPLQGPEFSGP